MNDTGNLTVMTFTLYAENLVSLSVLASTYIVMMNFTPNIGKEPSSNEEKLHWMIIKSVSDKSNLV